MQIQNKTLLFTNSINPILEEIILELSKKYNQNNIIITGKNPAQLKNLYKKIKKNIDNHSKSSIHYFSLDTRNYLQVKKMFKTIRKNMNQIDYLFHGDIYYKNINLKDTPINTIKLLFQHNFLSLLNLMKANQLYFDHLPMVYTLQTLNKDSLFFYLKENVISYLNNQLSIGKIYITENLISKLSHKNKIKEKKNKFLNSKELDIIITQILKNNKNIFLSNKDWIYYYF